MSGALVSLPFKFVDLPVLSFSLSWLAVMLHQGGMPPDKIGQIRERKKLVEQILAKDSDEMKRTVEVSVHTHRCFFFA